jgi:hypothetical protein
MMTVNVINDEPNQGGSHGQSRRPAAFGRRQILQRDPKGGREPEAGPEGDSSGGCG